MIFDDFWKNPKNRAIGFSEIQTRTEIQRIFIQKSWKRWKSWISVWVWIFEKYSQNLHFAGNYSAKSAKKSWKTNQAENDAKNRENAKFDPVQAGTSQKTPQKRRLLEADRREIGSAARIRASERTRADRAGGAEAKGATQRCVLTRSNHYNNYSGPSEGEGAGAYSSDHPASPKGLAGPDRARRAKGRRSPTRRKQKRKISQKWEKFSRKNSRKST